MNLKYIDAHSHLHFAQYNEDRRIVLSRMREHGVATIAVGTSLGSSAGALDLVRAEPSLVVGATVGQHPVDKIEEFARESFDALIARNRRDVLAIGECGLDYFRIDTGNESEKGRQIELFEKQIDLAVAFDLPLMLHIRSSNGTADAHDDAFEILQRRKQEHPRLHLHMHFFTMDYSVAEKFLALDATFGIPGVVTYKSAKDLQDAVSKLPLEKLLLESDAPYASPVPHRGKRNEPTRVEHIVGAIVKIRGEDFEKVRAQLVENTTKVFAIRERL